MAIKNFHNRLKEDGPSVNQQKDPLLAEDFDLVDFDDRQKRVSNQIQGSDFYLSDEKKHPIGYPLGPSKMQPNLVQTKSKLSSNLDQTESKLSPNLDQTKPKPSADPVHRKTTDSTGEVIAENHDRLALPSVPSPSDSGSEQAKIGKRGETKEDLVQTSSKPSSNLVQSKSKLRSNVVHTPTLPTDNLVQSPSKPGSQPRARPRANLVQTSSELMPTVPFSSLSGVQRNLVEYMYDNCKEMRDRFTDSFTSAHLASVTQATVFTVQSAIKRLIHKQIIARRDFRDGPGGWTSYWLADLIYKEMMSLENNGRLRRNLVQTSSKPGSQPSSQPSAILSSSSSIDNTILKTTTTESGDIIDKKNQELPPNWKGLDCSPLQDLNVPFGEAQLVQIYSLGKLTADVIQQSINGFAFDLEHNGKAKQIKTSPINFFMGLLRKGIPYSLPANYESPEDQAMREFLKSQEEYFARKDELKKRSNEIKFRLWQEDLSDSELRECVPESIRKFNLDSSAVQDNLREYFFQKILPHFSSGLTSKIKETDAESAQMTAEEIRAIADQHLGPVT